MGKTIQSLEKRLAEHVCNYRLTRIKSYKNSWIRSLKDKGLSPKIQLIQVVTKDWEFWESYWISQFRAWGFNLTNMTQGGEGCLGGRGALGYSHTESAKKSIGLKNSGPKSKEWINNAAEAMRKKRAVPIIQLTKKGKFLRRWKSICYAADFLGDPTGSKRKNIHACLNGKRPSAYGFNWKYVESKDKLL